MNDTDLINLIAKIWMDNGGDAEGFVWVWSSIHQRIKEMEKEQAK